MTEDVRMTADTKIGEAPIIEEKNLLKIIMGMKNAN